MTTFGSDPSILNRLNQLERSNRTLKRVILILAIPVALAAALGFQAGKHVIRADQLIADEIAAKAIVVQTDRGGTVRIDGAGITITAPGLAVNTTHLTEHEARIEIGMDYEWAQDNGLRPTPRLAVGRAGRDMSRNLVTRASIMSPEGVHSGDWHTNNPRHDGRTDRDLIEDLRRK